MATYQCTVCGVSRSETPFCHGPMEDLTSQVIESLRAQLAAAEAEAVRMRADYKIVLEQRDEAREAARSMMKLLPQYRQDQYELHWPWLKEVGDE